MLPEELPLHRITNLSLTFVTFHHGVIWVRQESFHEFRRYYYVNGAINESNLEDKSAFVSSVSGFLISRLSGGLLTESFRSLLS